MDLLVDHPRHWIAVAAAEVTEAHTRAAEGEVAADVVLQAHCRVGCYCYYSRSNEAADNQCVQSPHPE